MSLLLFVACCQQDPGYVNQKDPNYFAMMQNPENFEIDISSICLYCENVKFDKYYKHCNICDKCVKRYDHHCPWLNNCIGGGNQLIFICFLVSLYINIAIMIFVFRQKKEESIINKMFLVVSISFFVPITFLILIQVKNLLTKETTHTRLGIMFQKDLAARIFNLKRR